MPTTRRQGRHRTTTVLVAALLGMAVSSLYWGGRAVRICFEPSSKQVEQEEETAVAVVAKAASLPEPCQEGVVYHPPTGLRPLKKRVELGKLAQEKGFRLGAEVGVQQGYNAKQLLNQWNKGVMGFFLVDLWEAQDNYKDVANAVNHDAFFNTAQKQVEPWKTKTSFFRMLSMNALRYFPDASLDFIYIDARHDYCGVTQDITGYWPKLRPGGIMAGHDFHVNSDKPIQETKQDWSMCANGTTNPGAVQGAVEDFFVKKLGLTISVMYDEGARWPSWMVQKPTREECVTPQDMRQQMDQQVLQTLLMKPQQQGQSSTAAAVAATQSSLVFEVDDIIDIPASNPSKRKCILFSCSGNGYFLVESFLQATVSTQCDRKHFYGRTYHAVTIPAKNTIQHKVVSDNWCRVAILSDPNLLTTSSADHPLPYETIIYSDADNILDEAIALDLAEKAVASSENNNVMLINSKTDNGKEILRTNAFILFDMARGGVSEMITNWANHWRDVHLQDQTVLNELYTSQSPEISIVKHAIESKHCGSWLDKEKRLACLQA